MAYPVLLALPLGIIGLYLRHALEETPAFQQHVDTMEQGDREGLQDGPKVSFKEIATKHWRSLLTCIGLVISTNVTYYMLLTYMPSYLSHNLHYSEDHGVLIIIAIMVGMLFVQPVIGMLSDRFGRRPFILIGSVALFALSIPAFIMINSNVIADLRRPAAAGGGAELLYRGDGLLAASDVPDAHPLQRHGQRL